MRTIFLVDEEVWQSLPPLTITAGLLELRRIWAFIGNIPRERAMTVEVRQPAQFPETFDLSDGVVRLVNSNPAIEIRNALNRQRNYVLDEVRRRNIPFAFPASTRTASAPDSFGRAIHNKQVFTNGGRNFSLPIMASFTSLDAAVTETARQSIQRKDLIIERRKFENEDGTFDQKDFTDYFASSRSLYDSLDLVIIDSPDEPGLWMNSQQTLLGKVIGRVMAHEIRHLYVGSNHWHIGLGVDAPNLINDKTGGDFETDDRKFILKAIRKWEAKQGNATIIPTFSQRVRAQADSFPF